LIDDVTGGQDEPKRPVVSRRRGLGKGLGAILPSRAGVGEEPPLLDQLTGLPNRSALDERFEETMARCREDRASLAVFVVALDGFGEVNELYGHRVGDDLLHAAAARLSEARRRSDTVARFAGDEFVLVCPYVASPDYASKMAARILEDLSWPISVEGVEHHLSASIGLVVASFGDAASAQTLETLLGDASLAMRRAKDEGGASWKLFDPTMREDVEVRSQNRRDLRAALEEDDLVLDYEPIVDLESRVAIGQTAILGWRQPGPNVDQPQAPLDVVEEAGLAVPIGRWVLDQALADVRARRAGSGDSGHFRVWVKVAPSLAADPVLVDIVDELTAKHQVTPSVLGIDIREPPAAAVASTESTLRALEERDVLVALDDFGAGPSNLALLQRLPITSLKLAPDLVAALVDDTITPEEPTTAGEFRAGEFRAGESGADTLRREAAALVRGLIELGRALALTVVAQGVESEAQAVALFELGCEYAQGPFPATSDDEADERSETLPATKPPSTPEARVAEPPVDPTDAEPADSPVDSTDAEPADSPVDSTDAEPASAPAEPPGTESLWAPGTLTS